MIGRKNVALPEDLLLAVAEIARLEGKTADELVEETTRRMLYIRGLRSFVESNRRHAEQQGFCEEDVQRLVDEHRREMNAQ